MKRGSDKRLRGRAGQAQRARRLALYPVCAHCEIEGIVRPTDIIDHIRPLAFGGEDTDENCQGLCNWHNAIKTAAENASAGGGASHPTWLERPKCPAVVICGPPCGGKSTLAREMRRDPDVLVDLDAIATSIDPHWGRTWTPDLLNQALRLRNAMLGELARRSPPNGGRLLFVVSAPTVAERQWWADRLGAAIMTRDPGEKVATARAIARDGRADHVAAWYKRSRLPWSPEKPARKRTGSDEDGFPITDAGSDQDAPAGRPGQRIGEPKPKPRNPRQSKGT
jgi:5-methylcytosine-specific restriction protein A